MLVNKIVKRLVIVTIVGAHIAIGYASIPLSYCTASELSTIYGGACVQVCESFDPCDGCNGNCTGASDGTKCGKDEGQTAWKCKDAESGGGCSLGTSYTRYGKNCKCTNEECNVELFTSENCGSQPASCSTN